MKCPEHVLKCSIDKNLNEYFKSRKIVYKFKVDEVLYEVKPRVCRVFIAYPIKSKEGETYIEGKVVSEHVCYKDVEVSRISTPSDQPVSHTGIDDERNRRRD